MKLVQAVRSKDTKPELIVRRLLHSLGYRYRLHRKDMLGSPDLVFVSRRKVIFIHGCFWHGHNCKRGSREPKSNVDYWRTKVARKKARDALSLNALEESGWGTMVVWECQLTLAERDGLTSRLIDFLGPSSIKTAPQ